MRCQSSWGWVRWVYYSRVLAISGFVPNALVQIDILTFGPTVENWPPDTLWGSVVCSCVDALPCKWRRALSFVCVCVEEIVPRYVLHPNYFVEDENVDHGVIVRSEDKSGRRSLL